ncbi:hypothetical protein [Estrella lausannensis]|uniref:hypothetical protein n=1 Tax=Estrella lausannensis TaxID=483423 RepID=UPI001303F50B|nr:hypothetical protein [Estrella lausannensis]
MRTPLDKDRKSQSTPGASEMDLAESFRGLFQEGICKIFRRNGGRSRLLER